MNLRLLFMSLRVSWKVLKSLNTVLWNSNKLPMNPGKSHSKVLRNLYESGKFRESSNYLNVCLAIFSQAFKKY